MYYTNSILSHISEFIHFEEFVFGRNYIFEPELVREVSDEQLSVFCPEGAKNLRGAAEDISVIEILVVLVTISIATSVI